MKISETIKQRLVDAGQRFHSNDNISEYIKEGELEQLQEEVTEAFQDVQKLLTFTILIYVYFG